MLEPGLKLIPILVVCCLTGVFEPVKPENAVLPIFLASFLAPGLSKIGPAGRIASVAALPLLAPGVRQTARKVALTGLAGAGLIASRKKPVKPKTFNIGINLSSGKRSSEPSKYALKRQELLKTNPKKVPNKNIA